MSRLARIEAIVRCRVEGITSANSAYKGQYRSRTVAKKIYFNAVTACFMCREKFSTSCNVICGDIITFFFFFGIQCKIYMM